MLAREIATLDRVCGGRVEFGLGADWYTADYEQFGWTCDRPGVRIERLAEAVRLVKKYFSGERFSLQGKHYSVRDIEGYPLPIQRPHPTLVMGGGGPKMLALAGREADIVDFNFALQSGNMTDWSGPTATRESTLAKLAAVNEGAKGRALKLHGLGLTGDIDAPRRRRRSSTRCRSSNCATRRISYSATRRRRSTSSRACARNTASRA